MPTEDALNIGGEIAIPCDSPATNFSVHTRVRKSVLWFLLCVALVLIGLIVRVVFNGVTLLPWVQLLIAPLVVLAISQISICDRCVPLWVTCSALGGTLLGGILTYSHVDLSRGAFVVARFEEDALEKETKIFRDRIRKTVGWDGLTLVGSHYESVKDEREANSLLSANKRLGGVIWGTPRWLNVSLQHHSNLPLFEGEGGSFAVDYALPKKYQHLKIVTSVPGTGLSTSAEYPTVEFLGRLAQVWSVYLSALRSPNSEYNFEMLTRSLAGVKGRWTAFSHRALPMWMTGTYHLRRAVVVEIDSYGEVSCAIRAFSAALTQLRPGDNPELKAAILNNLALAYIIRAQLVKHRVTMFNQAKLSLKQAVNTVPQLSTISLGGRFDDAIDTIQNNAKILLSKKRVSLVQPRETVSKKVGKFHKNRERSKGQK